MCVWADLKENAAAGESRAVVEACVRVHVGDQMVERTARGTGEAPYTGDAVGQAYKAAVTNALKEALRAVVLYRVPSGDGVRTTMLVVRHDEDVATGVDVERRSSVK